ncbi:MAG: hypothetical protein MJ154_03000, partial [Candidatus Saccharibacteria bacterium]|nr:hypothetical protein [Candidatus Saccharibacteria bacterium]
AVAPYVVVKLGDNKYELYNAFGDKLSDFESSETPKISDDNAKTASAVSYDGGLIILNNRTFRVTKTVETNTRYDINAASEKGEIIVFSEKDKHYDKDAKRAIFNKEFVEFGDKCQKIKINNNFKNKERLYLTCDIDNKEHLIRNNEVTDVITSTYGGGYIVYDENHYVNYDSDKKKATFYVNGEEKASVDADYRLVISTKGYTINDYAKKYVAIYNLEGKQVYKISDAAAASELTGIDANENVIVRDGKQDTDKRYVLVNKEGKEISSRYTSMTEHGKYYSAFNRADNKGDLLDKDGQVIISGDYNEFVFYDEQEIILGRKGNYSDRSFDLINVKDKNVKVTFSGNVSLVDSGYFSFEKDGEVKIYTLEGKEIHSYKK